MSTDHGAKQDPASQPASRRKRKRPASLRTPEATGGLEAIKGFDFQRRYALILLLESLPDPEWSAVLVEGAEDVEARFDRQGRAERHAIQLKNYRVTAAKAREIVSHLQKLDEDSPGTWTAFVIACAELDETLKRIRYSLERYRDLHSYYPDRDPTLANTPVEVGRQIDAAKLQFKFVLEQVTLEPGLQSYREKEWAYARELWEQALRIFEAIEDPRAERVHGWLDELAGGSAP